MTLMMEGGARIEMERLLDRQSADLKEHFGLQLDPLRIQTTKTNGRVSVLEKMIWLASGCVLILTPWAFWISGEILKVRDSLTDIRVTAEINNN